MRRALTAAIVLALAMQLGSCAVVPWMGEPGYGVVVTNIRSDPTPYILHERGREKRLYSATATWWAYWWFLPIGFVEGGSMGRHLFDRQVQWWDCLAPYEMAWGPRKRDVGTIHELAEWASPAPFWVGDERQNEASRRWILGNDPLVIAMGTDKVKRGATELEPVWSLVRQADLDRTATELLIIDKWPPDWSHESPKGTEQDSRYEALLAKVARRVPFDAPMTLREIFQRQLWQPVTTSGPIVKQRR
jgi:hypothetical protein